MTAYILDGVVILIFVLSAVIGHKRGLIKTLSKVVAFLLAFVVALLLCGPAAEVVFDTAIAPSVRKSITDELNGSYQSAAESMEASLDHLPPFIKNALANQGVSSGKDVVERVSDVSGSPEAVADSVIAKVIRPVAVSLLRVICLLILFLVAFIAALILMKVLDVVAKLPGLKSVNKGLGFLAGAVSGLLWVIVAVSVLQAIAAGSDPNSWINPTVIEKTYVVKWIIGVNPVGSALQELVAVGRT